MLCGNLCVHFNGFVIVAAGFANVRGISFRSVLRLLRSLAGYSDVAATVLADDGQNIIRLCALGHQEGLQLDDLFSASGISVARIRILAWDRNQESGIPAGILLRNGPCQVRFRNSRFQELTRGAPWLGYLPVH